MQMAEENNNKNTSQTAGLEQSTPIKSKKDTALERLSARHNGTSYDDDEAIFGAINEDYDADQESLNRYRDNEKRLTDMMDKDPRSAEFLSAWFNGDNPVVALVRQYGDEFLDYITDPENDGVIAKAQKDYLERVAKEKEFEELYQKNQEETEKVLDAYVDEVGEEVANETFSKLVTMAQDIIVGKVTKEYLDMFTKAKNHDKDVAEASHVGEVKGRNANITNKVELKKKGDGIPNLDSRSGGKMTKKPQPNRNSIFELAAQAK